MIIVGDIHGKFDDLLNKIESYSIEGETFIQIGDFNLGYQSLEEDLIILNKINLFLVKKKCKMYVIRGNHDNPYFWSNDFKETFSNLFLIKDYSVITIEEKNVLFIGGGISLDRKNRITKDIYSKKITYWEDENIKPNIKFIKNIPPNTIDIIITHTPYLKYINYLFDDSTLNSCKKKDSFLDSDIKSEQTLLESYQTYLLKTQSNLKYWISGHMHKSTNVKIDNLIYMTLDIDEFFEIL